MSNKLNDIVSAAEKIVEDGEKLQLANRPKDEGNGELSLHYERWYLQASNVITQLAPERLNDFRECYKIEKRKEINFLTYTISDYLIGLQLKLGGRPIIKVDEAYSVKLIRQLTILASVVVGARSILRDIKTVLRAELFDSDMLTAREMFKSKHLRCAGVIAGVVLEAHLASVADRRQIKSTKKKPTLGDWNELFKEKSVYDVPMWRLIQRLGDIRNICAHSGGDDPKPDQVKDLLDGTDKVIKEVF